MLRCIWPVLVDGRHSIVSDQDRHKTHAGDSRQCRMKSLRRRTALRLPDGALAQRGSRHCGARRAWAGRLASVPAHAGTSAITTLRARPEHARTRHARALPAAPAMRATSCMLASRLQARSSDSSAPRRSRPAVERMVLLCARAERWSAMRWRRPHPSPGLLHLGW